MSEKIRVDIYLSEESYFILRQLKEQWKRKNMSQTVDHLIGAYWRIFKQLRAKRGEIDESRKGNTIGKID